MFEEREPPTVRLEIIAAFKFFGFVENRHIVKEPRPTPRPPEDQDNSEA